jgi:hypothetical protein
VLRNIAEDESAALAAQPLPELGKEPQRGRAIEIGPAEINHDILNGAFTKKVEDFARALLNLFELQFAKVGLRRDDQYLAQALKSQKVGRLHGLLAFSNHCRPIGFAEKKETIPLRLVLS